MSKAVVFDEYGPPEVMRVVERLPPWPGRGQVRVRILAAGVQPIDLAARSGWNARRRRAAQPPLPQTLGSEFSGVVDAVGEDVEGFALGDAVLGWTMTAAYAEHVVVGAEQLAHKPAAVGWYPAAVLPVSGQTAYAVLQALDIGPDDTLLVLAGAAGIGNFAVQLGRLRGATVVATDSEANLDYLRSLGAVPVADGPWLARRIGSAAPQGITAALDAAGGQALDVAIELVRDRHRIATLVDAHRAEELGMLAVRSRPSAERMRELLSLHAEGRLQVHISHAFPLEKAVDAHRLLETRRVRGKVVLAVDP